MFQKPCHILSEAGARSEEGRGGFINAATRRELATENCVDGWACKSAACENNHGPGFYWLLLAWELSLLDTHEPSRRAGAVASTS
jgi:hypothetical protein